MWATPVAPVPSVVVGSRTHNSRWMVAVGTVAVVLAVAVLGAACSGDSGTTELSSDAADQTTPGPVPTAPGGVGPTTNSDSGAVGTSGSVDVNELIRRIDDLNNESDLCTLLTGEALRDVTGSDINLTSLLSNPSGFTQLFSSLDKLFAHMVVIGPAEVQPSLTTMQGVWKSMATIDHGPWTPRPGARPSSPTRRCNRRRPPWANGSRRRAPGRPPGHRHPGRPRDRRGRPRGVLPTRLGGLRRPLRRSAARDQAGHHRSVAVLPGGSGRRRGRGRRIVPVRPDPAGRGHGGRRRRERCGRAARRTVAEGS